MNNGQGQQSEYNYLHFSPDLMTERFEGGPNPGDMAPDFTALTLDGNKVQLSDFRGERHVVLQFGSVTWPMTAAAAPGMERVRKDFQGQDVEFFLVYVREAHPGERYPAHETLEQKIRDAKALAELEGIGAKVLVDDLEGTIHRNYGQQPNMLYVIDKAGRVVYRALWAEEAALRRSLSSLLTAEENGKEVSPSENLSTLIPMLHGMSETTRVLERAGSGAVRDFQDAMGRSVLLVARIASWFRPGLQAAPTIRFALGGAALAVPALLFLLKGIVRKRKF